MILNSGLYVVSLVYDRQISIRYVLNFHGIKNGAYVFGIISADFCIGIIPSILLVIMGVVLDVDVFKEHWDSLLFSLILFNFPFITLVNVLGFLFSKSETAFKYILLVFFAVHMVT